MVEVMIVHMVDVEVMGMGLITVMELAIGEVVAPI